MQKHKQIDKQMVKAEIDVDEIGGLHLSMKNNYNVTIT
jgi:hypothetical protein